MEAAGKTDATMATDRATASPTAMPAAPTPTAAPAVSISWAIAPTPATDHDAGSEIAWIVAVAAIAAVTIVSAIRCIAVGISVAAS
jgi:hypothetical protein